MTHAATCAVSNATLEIDLSLSLSFSEWPRRTRLNWLAIAQMVGESSSLLSLDQAWLRNSDKLSVAYKSTSTNVKCSASKDFLTQISALVICCSRGDLGSICDVVSRKVDRRRSRKSLIVRNEFLRLGDETVFESFLPNENELFGSSVLEVPALAVTVTAAALPPSPPLPPRFLMASSEGGRDLSGLSVVTIVSWRVLVVMTVIGVAVVVVVLVVVVLMTGECMRTEVDCASERVGLRGVAANPVEPTAAARGVLPRGVLPRGVDTDDPVELDM